MISILNSTSTSTFDASRPGPIGSEISNTAAFTTAEFNGASGLSASAVRSTGAVFTGGTGTTTTPHWLIQPSGTTAATTWNTAGTAIGVNAASGFVGNFLDFHVAGGASVFSVSNVGAVSASASITSTINIRAGTSSRLEINGRGGFGASADGVFSLRNNLNSAEGSLTLGGLTSTAASGLSTPAVRLTGAIYTGVTGPTPHWLIEPTGTTAATDWATTGTIIGMNLPSPWNGNFADWKIAGVSLFKISPAGSVFASGSVNTGVGKELSISSNLKLFSTTIGVGTFRNFANDKDAQISVYGVRCVPVTLAMLTAAYPAATNAGMKAFITDSTVSHASMYVGLTAVGAGSHFAPVYSNGINYVIG